MGVSDLAGYVIEWPWLALVPASMLFALGRWRHRRVPLVAGWIWAAYFLYELGMKMRLLCTGECNIRVDLLVIYPALGVVTTVAIVALISPRRTEE